MSDEKDNPQENLKSGIRGVKVIIPDIALTATVHSNLVANKPPRIKSKGSGHKQVTVYDNTPIEPPVESLCDGDRLLIEDTNSKKVATGGNALISFVLAIIAFSSAYDDYSRNLPDDIYYAKIALGIAIFLIFLGIFLFYKYFRMNKEDFYVFDRTSGNVLLPKRFGCPAYSMPFSALALYTVHIPTSHGVNFRIFFYPALRPKGVRSIRNYPVILGFDVNDHISAAPYWHLITRFMDSTQELPHVDFISDQIQLFKKYNKTLSDIPFELDEEDKAKASAA